MYQRILVPVDGSVTANRGLDEAIRLARLSGGRIRVVHVLDQLPLVTGFEFGTGDILGMLQEAGAEILSAAKARVEAAGVPAEAYFSETLAGRICDIVDEQARQWGAEIIVIGTHGRRGVRRFVIGSDAEQIVRTARVPVLLVRAVESAAAAETEATVRVLVDRAAEAPAQPLAAT